MNSFSFNEQFQEILDSEDMLEGRFENDVNENPIYIGYSIVPNADPDDLVWYIQKIIYSGTAVVRRQLPDDNIGFKYSWTLRANYFAP